jgi:hypothetical protein
MTWQFSYFRALELMNDRQREAAAFRLGRIARDDDSERGSASSRPLVSRLAAAVTNWTGGRDANDADVEPAGPTSVAAHADQLELISHRS